MQAIESIRKNIKSSEDLRDIVKTMRTLAAVNINHFEKAVESINDYYRSVEMGFQVILRQGEITALESGVEKGGTYYLSFGSDQGLCGGFNEQMAEYVTRKLEKDVMAETDVMACTGVRLCAGLEAKKISIDESFPLPGTLAGITPVVQEIVTSITDLYVKGKIQSVILFYQKHVSRTSYNPVSAGLLPTDRSWINSIREKKWPSHVLPAYSMNRDALFSALFRQYIFVSLYRAFCESMASENAARLMSMQSAEKNIEERIETLNTLYRSERQNAITGELLDIVSGFEALRERE